MGQTYVFFERKPVALAVEIDQNIVASDFVETDLMREVGHVRVSIQRSVPMRLPVDPREVAEAARFLASDGASYITGHTLAVDGEPSAMAFSVN